MNAKRLIEQVLTEMPIDVGDKPDFIHPEKKQKFASRAHPMAKHPAYPDFKAQPGQKETNWEEVVASRQYQDTLGRLQTFFNRLHGIDQGGGQGAPQLSFQSIAQAMVQGLQDAQEMERPYRRALEKLAIQLMFEQPEFKMLKEPYEAGEFKIDVKLGVEGNLQNAIMGPEGGDEGEGEENGEGDEGEENGEGDEGEGEDAAQAQEAAEKLADFQPEIEKRRFINAMIAGGSVSKNYAYQLFNDKIAKISPGLPTLYGLIMAGTELGYFATGDHEIRQAVEMNLAGGSEEVDMEGDDVPVVKVRAMIFPMLVQELAKGLLELVSYEGLPKSPEIAQKVIDRADLADEEAWAMIMGRGLWLRFVNAIGEDADDVTLYLYNRVAQMPTEEFNQFMKIIQSGGPKATELVKGMIEQIRRDIDDEKHGTLETPGGEDDGGGNEAGEFGYGGDTWKG